ncbi:MAG: hypothetical protein N2657_00530 [bacterium]|nr:hypothetical protein [bacterium]
METIVNKAYKAKQNYFYIFHKILDEKFIVSITDLIFSSLGFGRYSFESIEHIKNMLNVLPVSIINPIFYISKDKKDLFLAEFFYFSSYTVLVFYYYSTEEKSNYEQNIDILLKEIVEKYDLSYSYMDLEKSLDFQYEDILGAKGIKVGLLKLLKEYKIHKDRIELDRYFIDSKVISISSSVLKGNYRDISIEDLKYMELLEKNNFLKIFVVFNCSSTGNSVFQMNRLDNLKVILESFRCPVCAKKLIEEKMEINLTISPFFEIYFTNYIWLKNVIFDYFSSIDGFRIYEYDKDVYIIRYMNSLYLFVFTNYENLLSSLSYYKDMEILNLSHSFFFVINIENRSINSSFIEKYKEKISVLNLNIESFDNTNFANILSNLKQKIEDLHNMTQFRNILITINYDNLLSYSDVDKVEDISIDTKEEILLEEKISVANSVANNLSESRQLELEIKDLKSEIENIYTDELQKFDHSSEVEPIILSGEEQRSDDELLLEIIGKKIDESSNYPEKNQEESFIEDAISELNKMLDSPQINSDQIDLKSDIDQMLSPKEERYIDVNSTESVLLESNSVIDSIEKETLNLDDLLKDVKVNFRVELDNDITMKDILNVFYHLLAGMGKEKLAFIEKNIVYFKQTLGSKIPDLKYYITIINPKGANSFPKDEIFMIKYYKPIIEKMNLSKDYYFSSRESYGFLVNNNSFFYSLFYNAAPNIIISTFALEKVFDNLIVYSYPSDLKALKLEIIRRSIDNLNNLKLSGVIQNFVLLNEDFDLLSEQESFDKGILYAVYNYYSVYSVADPIVWGWGSKDKGFYICIKFNNVILVVFTPDFSFNRIIQLYNGLYILEVI